MKINLRFHAWGIFCVSPQGSISLPHYFPAEHLDYLETLHGRVSANYHKNILQEVGKFHGSETSTGLLRKHFLLKLHVRVLKWDSCQANRK